VKGKLLERAGPRRRSNVFTFELCRARRSWTRYVFSGAGTKPSWCFL